MRPILAHPTFSDHQGHHALRRRGTPRAAGKAFDILDKLLGFFTPGSRLPKFSGIRCAIASSFFQSLLYWFTSPRASLQVSIN